MKELRKAIDRLAGVLEISSHAMIVAMFIAADAVTGDEKEKYIKEYGTRATYELMGLKETMEEKAAG